MKLRPPTLAWLIAPVALCVVGAVAGHAMRTYAQAPFFTAPPLVNKTELTSLEGATAASIANAVWAFADVHTARRVMHDEFRRLQHHSGLEKARPLIRFAMLDPSPDGRASLFSQACSAHPPVCDDRRAAALREIEARFVAPGNSLPLGMLEGGHPPIPGHP